MSKKASSCGAMPAPPPYVERKDESPKKGFLWKLVTGFGVFSRRKGSLQKRNMALEQQVKDLMQQGVFDSETLAADKLANEASIKAGKAIIKAEYATIDFYKAELKDLTDESFAPGSRLQHRYEWQLYTAGKRYCEGRIERAQAQVDAQRAVIGAIEAENRSIELRLRMRPGASMS